jgi:hypothetical protein
MRGAWCGRDALEGVQAGRRRPTAGRIAAARRARDRTENNSAPHTGKHPDIARTSRDGAEHRQLDVTELDRPSQLAQIILLDSLNRYKSIQKWHYIMIAAFKALKVIFYD